MFYIEYCYNRFLLFQIMQGGFYDFFKSCSSVGCKANLKWAQWEAEVEHLSKIKDINANRNNKNK